MLTLTLPVLISHLYFNSDIIFDLPAVTIAAIYLVKASLVTHQLLSSGSYFQTNLWRDKNRVWIFTWKTEVHGHIDIM